MVLSIILPVYNMDTFVKKCIHSIIDFCPNHMHIEVIAVNDGSTDNSLDELRSIDDKRLRIIDQPNAGVSSARNRGLEEASGDYVWLIDPDDYLSDNFIVEVYNLLIKKAPEMLLFGINWVDEDKLLGKREYPAGEFTVPEIMTMRIYDSNVWSRVIKRQLIEAHGIRFIDVINGEDFEFCIKVFCHTKKVIIPEIIGYNYLTNPNGSSKKRAQTHLENLASHSVKTLEYLRVYFESSKGKLTTAPEVFKPWVNNNIFGLLYSLYRFNYTIPFTKSILASLSKDGQYPVSSQGLGKKQKLFLSVANKQSIFLPLLKFKRHIG